MCLNTYINVYVSPFNKNISLQATEPPSNGATKEVKRERELDSEKRWEEDHQTVAKEGGIVTEKKEKDVDVAEEGDHHHHEGEACEMEMRFGQ